MIKANKIFVLIMVLIVGSASCAVDINKATIDNISACASLEGDVCGANVPIFNPSDPVLFVSCRLNNAPSNTHVTFVWKYVNGRKPIVMDKITITSSDFGFNADLNSSLNKPYNNWPEGKYEINISIDGSSNNPSISYFEVR